jgi:sugar phosphate isomerase/epimerase
MPPYDRRAFLATLAAAAAGGAAATGAPFLAAARDAVAATRPRRPVGVQLYTVRSAMQKDVPGTLARVAKIGYREVEFAGYFGLAPKRIRALLDAHGLRAPSSHLQLAPFAAGWDAALEAAHVIGHEWLVVPWLDAAARGTLDDVRRTAAGFDRAGEAAKAAGLRFAYHNHDFDFIPVEGRRPLDVLLESTDPALVSFELDLYWAVKAGADPLAYFAAHPGRFTMLHAKDSSGAPAHRMTEVGSGTLDFPRLLAAGRKEGVRHVFVEHDEPTDPFASITTSYRYLSKIPW